MNKKPKVWSAALPATVGFASIVLLGGTLGAWSIGTRIAGAVVAPGTVEVENRRQVIEHPDGGVVGEIRARDGDIVAAGDILVRIDGTFLALELSIVERQLMEIFARKARLEAERDEAEMPDFSGAPTYTSVDPAVLAEQVAGQGSLFDARRQSLSQLVQQFREQQKQIEQQIDGADAQLVSLERQLVLIQKELADLQGLFESGLVQAPRLLQLQREEARLHGEIGALQSSKAEARTRISALEIEIVTAYDERREEAIARLRDLEYSQIELEERRIGLLEQLLRLDVRAPVSGIIFGSLVTAVKSVVQAAEPMMYIVPEGEPLQVSARIDPVHIEQVFVGQDVSLMFTTFNRRTTPEVRGSVLRVSADAATDEKTGLTYYEATLVPDPDKLSELEHVTLLPGMPVEAYLKTEDRTPLSYLTQPLTIYFSRAFREE